MDAYVFNIYICTYVHMYNILLGIILKFITVAKSVANAMRKKNTECSVSTEAEAKPYRLVIRFLYTHMYVCICLYLSWIICKQVCSAKVRVRKLFSSVGFEIDILFFFYSFFVHICMYVYFANRGEFQQPVFLVFNSIALFQSHICVYHAQIQLRPRATYQLRFCLFFKDLHILTCPAF